jgi:hypothetical protein
MHESLRNRLSLYICHASEGSVLTATVANFFHRSIRDIFFGFSQSKPFDQIQMCSVDIDFVSHYYDLNELYFHHIAKS